MSRFVKFTGAPRQEKESLLDWLLRSQLDAENAAKFCGIGFLAVLALVAAVRFAVASVTGS